VRIERFDPRAADEARLRACHEMAISGQAEDDPNSPAVSFEVFRGWWIYGFVGEPQEIWLAATDSGVPLGAYVLVLPDRENRAIGFLDLIVALSSRRHGIGTALLVHAAEQADAAGRTLLSSETRVGSPGHSFAAAACAKPGLEDARRVLDFGPGLSARLPGLRAAAEPRAAGYTLRRWSGPVPEDLVGAACSLYTAMEDAPHDEAIEPMRWDPAMVRTAEEREIAQGLRTYSVAAMQDTSGDMAALTQVSIDPAVDGWAFQEITAVTRPHRGHRLGLLVKVAMLEWLAEVEPQVRQIMTFNAVQNEHMVAVNAELGHRISDYFQSFELDVAAARKLAGSR
jgi:GNAT superfamily N-acetyltransferase